MAWLKIKIQQISLFLQKKWAGYADNDYHAYQQTVNNNDFEFYSVVLNVFM